MTQTESFLKTRRLLDTARRQFRLCCIPMATAILVSVGIGRLGISVVPLLLLGGAGCAYWLGWRVLLVREPGDGRAQDQTRSESEEETPKEGA